MSCKKISCCLQYLFGCETLPSRGKQVFKNRRVMGRELRFDSSHPTTEGLGTQDRAWSKHCSSWETRPLAMTGGAAALPPVIDHIEPRVMVARLVGLMHGDTLKVRAEAMRAQRAICFRTSQIHSGFQTRQVPCGRQCFAGVQEASETRLGGGAW